MNEISSQISVIIPFRIDCPERERNLKLVLEYLSGKGMHIYLLEADDKPRFRMDKIIPEVKYHFVKDTSKVFHKTRYLNKLFSLCHTPVVAIWDTDVLLSYRTFEKVTQLILGGDCDVCIPYSGLVKALSPEQTIEYAQDNCFLSLNENLECYSKVIGRPSCGGVVLINYHVYQASGGMNEYFKGWGPEDAELIHRLDILEYKVRWEPSGTLFHLWHPRNVTENYVDQMPANQAEFIKVCCMDTNELRQYVQSWNFI